MYAGLIQRKGGLAGAAAAVALAAAAANKNQSDDTETNADNVSNEAQGPTLPRGGDGARASDLGGIKKVLPQKKLNSDGSFGDPRLKYQPGSKVPLPWTCPHPECGRNNFQWRKSCPHCGTKRPPPEQQNHEPATIAEVTVISEQKKDEEPPVKKPRPAAQPPAEVTRGNQANPNLQVRWELRINIVETMCFQSLGTRKPAALPPDEVKRGNQNNPNLQVRLEAFD